MRLIDADALKEKSESATDTMNTYQDMSFVRVTDIDNAPTVDLIPVAYGNWLPDGISLKCSLCGKWFVIEQGDAEINYCINCGAKMEEK